MSFWTDYPVLAFGDEPNKPAPWRRCTILGVADHKHLRVVVKGDKPLQEAVMEIKALRGGYVYLRKGYRSSGISLWHDVPE